MAHPSFSCDHVSFMRKPCVLGKKESTSLRSTQVLENLRRLCHRSGQVGGKQWGSGQLSLLPHCDVFSVGAVSDLSSLPPFESFNVISSSSSQGGGGPGRSRLFSLDRMADLTLDARKELKQNGSALGKAVNLLEAARFPFGRESCGSMRMEVGENKGREGEGGEGRKEGSDAAPSFFDWLS
eukprot:CAMPEP_0113903530 /NCGR_PEP_ID=MMETSP0780_2-20120614/22605_1 /TAXON_ID=652834 /ORGANISM="Palpitomonas bilix" /LENGTH=181 /DNA_ID=CAMNT_0000896753 /DNA_START=483 /DNA_END=1024 /DNA_ORIENTATION=- /assembly_acc=CAM_ASM_000599